MKRREFLQVITVVPSLPYLTSSLAKKYDFSTDRGLRLAVESLFPTVVPFHWELHDKHPGVIYAIGTDDPLLMEEVRKSLFSAMRGKTEKHLMWRSWPVSFDDDLGTICSMRVSLW